MEISVFEFGNEYICRSFFDVDSQFNYLDVSLNGNHLGSIVELYIPDEYDEDFDEEFSKFETEVISWVVDNEY
jgi:hypothetical protein